jgi:hypothetical protein
MGTIRRRNSEDIRQRALETAARKQREGCESCAASYLDLAREHGATETEIARAMGQTGQTARTGFSLGRRRLLQVTASALAAGAAGALLIPGRASARSALAPVSANEHSSSASGFFGVDSCTSPERGRVAGMPLQYYIGELGATKHNAGCFDENTAAFVTPAFTHGYWGVCGPNESDADPAAYGRQQADAAIEAWNSNVNLGGRTIFADIEGGFGGWGAPASRDDHVALLDAFISHIAEEGFIPGVYISNNDKANWFPGGYKPSVPFVYWVAGGKLAGSMCAPCKMGCDTLGDTVDAWKADAQSLSFGGMAAVVWQYWLSGMGCGGDFNYSPQSGYSKFMPVTVEERQAEIKAATQTPTATTTPTP